MAGTSEAVGTYREVLALPGVGRLYAVGFAARLPLTATSVVLTLHVAVGLDRGFAAAGLVGGAITAGTALGAPLLGRLVDRFALRPVLLLCGLTEATFWGVAPALGVGVLVPAAFVAGVLSLPAFSVVRQSLGVAVPGALRRPAFALDAMSAEISYIAGPGLGTAAVLALPSGVALRLVGVGFVLATALLWRLDPPTAGGDAASGPPPPLRSWLRPPMLVALAGAAAAILLLTATELGVVAGLTDRGETGWFALANTVWCLTSLVGGFVHGAAARPRSMPVLLGLLALGTVPVAFGGPWWVVTLLLVPAGACCAPALAASSEAVVRLAPETARGVATGLHGTAIMGGAAVAQPLTGLLVDTASPAVAILAAVGVCALVAGAASTVPRHDRSAGPGTDDRRTTA